jgi:hypothetical protein
MSINKYKPHVLVLPEDQANAEMANGFLLHPQLNDRSIQVLPYVGGWTAVVEKFTKNFIPKMRQYPHQWFVLLMDFDRTADRLNYVKEQLPEDIQDRVFVLGVLSEPEELRNDLGQSLEWIGESLAASCADHTYGLWDHNLLQHNKTELTRMIASVKPFLFR